MSCNLGKLVESYQYLSNPNPTVISFETSSALFGSTCFERLTTLEDEPPVEIFLLVPVGSVECFGDSCVVSVGVAGTSCSNGGGRTTLSGFGWSGIRDLVVFLPDLEDLGDFIFEFLKVLREVRRTVS